MNIGDVVTAHYKSGKYIGTITNKRTGGFTVKIASVLRHPAQGDLHHPNQADGVFFHERKALAHHEQANIPEAAVHPYDGEIVPYDQSLVKAVQKLESRFTGKDDAFSEKSLEALQSVKKEYALMYNLSFN